MNFQLWKGDDNDRSCIAQFLAKDWDTAIAHVRETEVNPYLQSDPAILFSHEDGDELTYYWNLYWPVTPEDAGYTEQEVKESPWIKQDLWGNAYFQLNRIEEFASYYPTPYTLEEEEGCPACVSRLQDSTSISN